LDKLQLSQGESKSVHPHHHHPLHTQDKSSESSDYESKDGGGGGAYTPEAGSSGGLYSPEGGGGGYYLQPGGGGELGVAGQQSPDLSHPTYGGYSTTGAFGLASSPLVRPRSNKNKSQAGGTSPDIIETTKFERQHDVADNKMLQAPRSERQTDIIENQILVTCKDTSDSQKLETAGTIRRQPHMGDSLILKRA
jgi:hypothetical protein